MPTLVSERSHRFRIALPVCAPSSKLQGARKLRKTGRTARVRVWTSREQFAVREEKLEVFTARRGEILQFVCRIVEPDDTLQQSAGLGRNGR